MCVSAGTRVSIHEVRKHKVLSYVFLFLEFPPETPVSSSGKYKLPGNLWYLLKCTIYTAWSIYELIHNVWTYKESILNCRNAV